MRRQIYLLAAIFLLGLISLTGCNQADAAGGVPAAGSQLVATPRPDTAAYRAKLDEAHQSLEKGDFETAKNLAQEAARLNPADNTAWSVFEEATLKQSADAYLRTLPDSRHRLDAEHFLADQVNGKQYFILDVREADEYEAGHIDDAVNIPLREITQNLTKNVFLKSNLVTKPAHYVTLSDQRERRVSRLVAFQACWRRFFVASLLRMTFKKRALNCPTANRTLFWFIVTPKSEPPTLWWCCASWAILTSSTWKAVSRLIKSGRKPTPCPPPAPPPPLNPKGQVADNWTLAFLEPKS